MGLFIEPAKRLDGETGDLWLNDLTGVELGAFADLPRTFGNDRVYFQFSFF